MATKFLEPGGDATFDFSMWAASQSNIAVASDIVHGGHLRSIRPNVGLVITQNILSDAGARISFYLYITAQPSATADILLIRGSSDTQNVASIRITSGGVLQLWNGATANQIGSDGSTLSTGVWYRISLAYTIGSTTSNRFELFKNGVSDISVTNATLGSVSATNLRIGNIEATSTFDTRLSDFYIDDSSALTDPGDIWVTAKRPNANGSLNNFTTQIGSGGSGYGSGHSPQVNERALNTANGWSVVGAGNTSEFYNIESASTGDIDISTGSIIDYVGWLSASSLLSENGNMIIGGSTISGIVTTDSTIRIFTWVKGSSTYPAGAGDDIGIQTDATVTTVSLYECGIIVAYIPGNTTTTRTETGLSRIAKNVSQTEAGVANIRNTTTRTVTGKASVQKTTTQTETGKSRMQKAVSQTEAGVANIRGVTNRTVAGLSRVSAITEQSITGVSSIYVVPAKTLTIAGVDFLPQYQTGSGVITEVVQNKANKMNMVILVKSGQALPREGSEVVYKDLTRFLFGGYISRVEPQETGIGQLFTCQVEVSDYSYIFNNKVARRAYENQTLKYIVEDLMDTYVDSRYGFTTTNVDTGPTIPSINFDHISIRKCFEKLQKLTGYVWYVDYEKNLFFQTVSAQPAPESFTDAGGNHQDLKISYDTAQVRNSVIVIGSPDGEESVSTTIETFEGDGATRTWPLSETPSTVVSVTLNGVSKSIAPVDQQADTDYFIYSADQKFLQVTESNPTPVGGGTPDEIIITYYSVVPIIAQEIDPASIAFFAALDGGDGVMEYSIKDSTILTKQEASERALQELDQYADPLVDGRVTTRTGLLESGSIFTAGQYLTINSPVNEIDVDTAFLIQEVIIRMVEDDYTTEYIYEIRFGGRVVGIQEFLESLASEEGEVTDADVVITIESTSDLVVLDDDAPTDLIETPPYQVGPGGSPQARVNMSEVS